ncbi:hypothetical protein JAAARDRAFT_192860 [Jaapia argillacea MUCL 33604]|uniref:HAT C-terminal dimerisation domain-containing protein n=1 Tax=Jaapia argillacea MUCL 33604 TaxID=933084 RepID=A0A067Q9U8_9AGAM|nr:hypothetical protein JAAARDRAFT_192860 [Jaapia argillacea MUCL 33604]
MLQMWKAVDRFTSLADGADEVPVLVRKNYSDFTLTRDDWSCLVLMHEVLREPAQAHQTFLSASHATLWRAIPILEYLQETWETMAKANLTLMFFVLNPSYKLAYFEDKWDDEWLSVGRVKLEAEFKKYYKLHATSSTPASGKDAGPTPQPVPSASYGKSWMMSTVLARRQLECNKYDPQQELKEYLDSPLVVDLEDDGLIRWWGHHAAQYPILSKMAQDYLAIQGSAVSAECTFSSGAITGTCCRNWLRPDIFEALQLLKSAYRNGQVLPSEPGIDVATYLELDTTDDV